MVWKSDLKKWNDIFMFKNLLKNIFIEVVQPVLGKFMKERISLLLSSFFISFSPGFTWNTWNFIIQMLKGFINGFKIFYRGLFGRMFRFVFVVGWRRRLCFDWRSSCRRRKILTFNYLKNIDIDSQHLNYEILSIPRESWWKTEEISFHDQA